MMGEVTVYVRVVYKMSVLAHFAPWRVFELEGINTFRPLEYFWDWEY